MQLIEIGMIRRVGLAYGCALQLINLTQLAEGLCHTYPILQLHPVIVAPPLPFCTLLQSKTQTEIVEFQEYGEVQLQVVPLVERPREFSTSVQLRLHWRVVAFQSYWLLQTQLEGSTANPVELGMRFVPQPKLQPNQVGSQTYLASQEQELLLVAVTPYATFEQSMIHCPFEFSTKGSKHIHCPSCSTWRSRQGQKEAFVGTVPSWHYRQTSALVHLLHRFEQGRQVEPLS